MVKVDGVDPVVAGTSFAYTVTVSNGGPSDSVGVVLTDVLPGGVTFVSAVPVQGSCSEAAGTVTCPLGTIAAGGSVDRKSTRLNSCHTDIARMPSTA